MGLCHQAWRVRRLRMEERPLVWKTAANILIKQSRTADKGWSFSLGFGKVLAVHHCENVSCYELFLQASALDWSSATTLEDVLGAG
jgi:hypothetical protein